MNEDFSIFKDVYDVIKERKANPKEGSYTNYLFDKGIDKICKKVVNQGLSWDDICEELKKREGKPTTNKMR
jgi:phosphoribosyl-ATP pyrophosphohydrolase/phosphoribosyl-AMP cyclohydrolase